MKNSKKVHQLLKMTGETPEVRSDKMRGKRKRRKRGKEKGEWREKREKERNSGKQREKIE